jgi:hypothetical protein
MTGRRAAAEPVFSEAERQAMREELRLIRRHVVFLAGIFLAAALLGAAAIWLLPR